MRVMGDKAPDTLQIIQINLIGRDARGLADEYLDTVGWPLKGGRSVTASRRSKALVIPAIAVGSPVPLKLPRQRVPVDPSRN